jgi:hypothetical protein
LNKDSTASYLLRLICLIWAAGVGLLSLLLLFVAVTLPGRLFAITALAVAVIPIMAHSAWRKNSRGRAIVTSILLIAVVGGFVFFIAHAPKGTATAQSNVRNLYAGGIDRFSRYQVGNLLPEVDQLMLGLTVIPAVDRLFTQGQASKLKKWTAAIYRELDADESFHECGSAMPIVYDELLGSDATVGHAFLYIPPKLDRTKPAPTLVFLHGSGGNFKAYLWLLSRMADRLNFVVLAPSYGMGNWRWPESSKVVNAAIAAAAAHVAIANDNIHVMGLSNGGLRCLSWLGIPGLGFGL